MKKLTINQMIRAIEKKVIIRKIWVCRAGWGMCFVTADDISDKPEGEWVVYKYYPSLEKCVQQEYKYWVLGKNLKSYPERDSK